MGSIQPSALKLPSLPKEHWHQVPLPMSPPPKHSHGTFKLLRNTLTNEQIEQYSLTFRSSVQFQQYLESFRWRLRQENFVNTRYIDYSDEGHCCRQQETAKIYIEHIPLRLSNIQDIPEPENLYVLMAAFEGFEKLYKHLGYFKTSEDMVGIDREGRVKVWLNSNYSKNYLYGPYYIEGIVDPLTGSLEKEGQQAMVWDIVQMIEDNTTQEIFYPFRISQFFLEHRGTLSFLTARGLIYNYSKKYHITIPTYFESILRIFDQGKDPISQEDKSLHIHENHQLKSLKKIVHYMDPAEDSSQAPSNSKVNISQPIYNQNILKNQKKQEIRLSIPGRVQSAKTTGETQEIKGRSFSQFKTTDYNPIPNRTDNNIPKINFRYEPNPSSPKYIFSKEALNETREALNPTIINIIKEPPLISKNSTEKQTEKKSLSNHRLTYSNVNKAYELDEEMVQDMLRYNNS